ncbi:MAG: hypothetical protein J5824_07240, partial [Lachnospiraceae bacterium]|nr:hypothetical protein [Lachnospiraceae bacterium]
MKKIIAILLVCALTIGALAGCSKSGNSGNSGNGGNSGKTEELTGVDKIIQEAQGMTLEELAKKAIEESKGKTFYGVGNSSRGKSALPLFIE